MTLNVQNAKKIGIGGSKNLFNKTAATLNSTLTWAYGADYAQTGSITSDYMSTSDGTAYSSNYYMLIFCYDADKTYLGYINQDGTLSKASGSAATYKRANTVPSNQGVVYIRVVWRSSSPGGTSDSNPSDMTSQNIMLNLGSTALPYEAYVAPSEVRAIHDKDNRLLWGRLEYDTKYEGDAWQQTYTGKNLFNTPDDTGTVNGVDYVVQGNVITLNGTCNVSGTKRLDPITAITLDGTYTTTVIPISGTYTGTNQSNINVRHVSDNTLVSGSQCVLVSGAANNPRTWTIANDSIRFGLYTSNGEKFENYKFKIQVEKGSTSTAYEPYVGGVPAPNPDYPQDIKVVEGPQTITVRGKNKFSLDYYGTFAYGRSGNITQTHTDTSAHMVATGTTGVQYVRTTIDGFDPMKTYVVSCKSKKIVKGVDGQPGLRIYIQYSDDGSSFAAQTATNIDDPVQGQEYTLSASFSGHSCYRFYFYNNSSDLVSIGEETEYWDIQVEEGRTTTTFEAFQGKTYSFDLRGKNLFNFDNGTLYTQNSVTQTHTSNSVHMVATGTTGAQYVRLAFGGFDSSKKYTISCKARKVVKGTDGAPRVYINIYFSDDGSTWTYYTNTGVTDPVQGQVYDLTKSLTGHPYYRFYLYNNVNTPVTVGEETEYWDVQLEEGGTATDFQPYHAPYELAGLGDYKDYIWKDGTDWKLHKVIGNTVLLRTTGDYDSGNNWYYERFSNIGVPDGVRDAGIMSNYFTAADSYNGMQIDLSNGLIATSGTHVVIRNTACTDQATYRTWLAAHKVAVYYVLATATDSVITNAALIAQLNAMQEWLNRYGYHADVVGDLPIVINQESL